VSLPGLYVVGGLAQGVAAEKARTGIVIRYLRDVDRGAAAEPLRSGLPRLTTIEVTPEETEPNAVKLDTVSRAKLVGAGVDPDVVERELRGMERGDRKLLAEVVYGAESGVPRAELEEQLRWFCISPTEEEERRIADGEAVTFLVDG
jgi:hypothetical protein